jgi:hypothetical protein
LAPNRQFSQSTTFACPRKDSQDRNSINTESTEYSKSGSDDQAAALDDAAFNPDITDPEPEGEKAGQDSVSKSLSYQRDINFFRVTLKKRFEAEA